MKLWLAYLSGLLGGIFAAIAYSLLFSWCPR